MVTAEKGALMANTYFNYKNPVQPGQPLHSSKYNGDFLAIQRAFDELPSPTDLVTSFKSYAVSTGTSDAYMVTLTAFDQTFGYIEGMSIIVRIHVDNTGPATLSVNGLPPKDITNLVSGNGPLVARDMRMGAIYALRYDGVNFQLVSSSSNVVEATRNYGQLANQYSVAAQTAADKAQAASNMIAQISLNPVGSAAINTVLLATTLRVGCVKLYADTVTPGDLYPGTTWLIESGTYPAGILAWRRTA